MTRMFRSKDGVLLKSGMTVFIPIYKDSLVYKCNVIESFITPFKFMYKYKDINGSDGAKCDYVFAKFPLKELDY